MTDKSTNRADIQRRNFLKSGALLMSFSLASGVNLMIMNSGANAQANAKIRWGLLIDANKCSPECDACIRACANEHGWENNGKLTDPQWIRKVKLKNKQTGREVSLPLMCQHCEFPPCVDVCPTGASFKRKDGIVLVDRHICIGCRYCMMACPYKARSFVHEKINNQKTTTPRGKGTVEACNLCVHKLDRGDGITACAQACENSGNGAIIFGNLNDKNSKISRALANYPSVELRDDLGLNLAVRYQNI